MIDSPLLQEAVTLLKQELPWARIEILAPSYTFASDSIPSRAKVAIILGEADKDLRITLLTEIGKILPKLSFSSDSRALDGVCTGPYYNMTPEKILSEVKAAIKHGKLKNLTPDYLRSVAKPADISFAKRTRAGGSSLADGFGMLAEALSGGQVTR